MDDRFVTLASLVASAAQDAPAAVHVVRHVETPEAARERPALDATRADIAAELTLVRLAALEAFECAISRLLLRLASDVLARELLLAPSDLAALAARTLAAFAEAEPVALVVAPNDVAAFDAALPVRGDASLAAGDLIVEVRDGTVESRFALRVSETVARVAAESVV